LSFFSLSAEVDQILCILMHVTGKLASSNQVNGVEFLEQHIKAKKEKRIIYLSDGLCDFCVLEIKNYFYKKCLFLN
jgi:hypothetical protein